jgi:hypothetical protein
MSGSLTSGQRFWLLYVTAFFVSGVVTIIVAWPKADPAILADLRSPDCAEWRELPAGTIPDIYPNPDDKCYALRRLLVEKRVSVRSEDEYDGYLAGQRGMTVVRIASWWLVVCLGIYALGWGAVKLVNRNKSGQKAA